jgi:hypothetical protein
MDKDMALLGMVDEATDLCHAYPNGTPRRPEDQSASADLVCVKSVPFHAGLQSSH